MKHLPLAWTGEGSLEAELGKPIQRITAKIFHPAHGPNSVVLWRRDGSGLELFTKMEYVAERMEVGVLQLETTHAHAQDEIALELISPFTKQISAHKLTISVSGTTAESGVVLISGPSELIIVAGSFPCSVAVGGVLWHPNIYEPEYPLDEYVRTPIG